MFCDDVIKALPSVERFTRYYAGKYFSQDIMSEIKVRALELGFENRGVKIETWLNEIAKFVCKNEEYQRKRHMLLLSDFSPEMVERYDYQPSNIMQAEYIRLLNILPKMHRKIIMLTMQGYKCREIAKETGLKPESVKSALWQARNKLKSREN